MARAIIVYGSTTGNTELMAGHVAIGMKEAGADVTIKDVRDANIDELTGYDIVVLGSSTWNGGELQEDFIDFYDDLEELPLEGTKAAAFGPGDSNHESFCAAVDMLEQRLRERGATLVAPSMKVDGDVEAVESETREWGKQVASRATAPAA